MDKSNKYVEDLNFLEQGPPAVPAQSLSPDAWLTRIEREFRCLPPSEFPEFYPTITQVKVMHWDDLAIPRGAIASDKGLGFPTRVAEHKLGGGHQGEELHLVPGHYWQDMRDEVLLFVPRKSGSRWAKWTMQYTCEAEYSLGAEYGTVNKTFVSSELRWLSREQAAIEFCDVEHPGKGFLKMIRSTTQWKLSALDREARKFEQIRARAGRVLDRVR